MAAPKKNKYWQVRGTHGRKKVFASPSELWTACCAYFEWVEKNPLKEEKLFAFQGKVTRAKTTRMRAMTVEGLCLHLGITRMTWGEYRGREDFVYITTRVDDIIREQKFVGAAADLFNANIIARDLGLMDKQGVEHSGRVEGSDINQIDIANRIRSFLELAKSRMPKD